jgi:hypothetical protein
MALGHAEAEQDGSRQGWWSKAAHIMVARKQKERKHVYNKALPLEPIKL